MQWGKVLVWEMAKRSLYVTICKQDFSLLPRPRVASCQVLRLHSGSTYLTIAVSLCLILFLSHNTQEEDWKYLNEEPGFCQLCANPIFAAFEASKSAISSQTSKLLWTWIGIVLVSLLKMLEGKTLVPGLSHLDQDLTDYLRFRILLLLLALSNGATCLINGEFFLPG